MWEPGRSVLCRCNDEMLKTTNDCQNHRFCRLPIISILGFVLRTYKKDGFGSQWNRSASSLGPWFSGLFNCWALRVWARVASCGLFAVAALVRGYGLCFMEARCGHALPSSESSEAQPARTPGFSSVPAIQGISYQRAVCGALAFFQGI